METLIWQKKMLQPSIDFNSHRRAIAELVNGRDLAIELQTLLRKDENNDVSALLARDAAEKILASFSETIYMLSSIESGELCYDGGSEEDSGTSKKRASPGSKAGRGCYKRRKETQTWIEESTTIEDNFAWRKYGQKEILNAKFPRCYFRCTHKHEQGCKATKQVQKTEDNPEMYRITYIGVHTCQRNNNLSPQIMVDADTSDVSDGLKPGNNNHGHVSVPAIVKQEYIKEDTPSDVTENNFSPLGSLFETETPMDRENDFASLDMDDIFLDSCVGIDASDFVLDGINWNCSMLSDSGEKL